MPRREAIKEYVGECTAIVSFCRALLVPRLPIMRLERFKVVMCNVSQPGRAEKGGVSRWHVTLRVRNEKSN